MASNYRARLLPWIIIGIMLPDFPSLKEEVGRHLEAKLRNRAKTLDPVLSQIKSFSQHEGRDLRYERVDAPIKESGPEVIQAKFEVLLADVPFLLGEKLDAKMEEMAKELAAQQAGMLFRRVEEDCKELGTAVNADGAPLSAELILDMIGSVQADFGPDGKPLGQFVIHPDMVPALKKAGEEFERDPELQRKHGEILERQRAEWVTRQSNRKLVD